MLSSLNKVIIIIILLYLTHYENLPMQYIQRFYQQTKMIFSIFLLKTLIIGTRRVVLMGTHNLYFGAKIRKKKVYPCKPQFALYKRGMRE